MLAGKPSLRLLALQVLANLAATCPQGQADAWSTAYPSLCTQLVHSSQGAGETFALADTVTLVLWQRGRTAWALCQCTWTALVHLRLAANPSAELKACCMRCCRCVPLPASQPHAGAMLQQQSRACRTVVRLPRNNDSPDPSCCQLARHGMDTYCICRMACNTLTEAVHKNR